MASGSTSTSCRGCWPGSRGAARRGPDSSRPRRPGRQPASSASRPRSGAPSATAAGGTPSPTATCSARGGAASSTADLAADSTADSTADMGPDFSDRLIAAIRAKRSPCVVGLDPRLETMPRFLVDEAAALPRDEAAGAILAGFGRAVVDAVAEHVPAVKVQSAFYEVLGVPGLRALLETVRAARAAGLLVILDAKRGDIASTAAAYAEALLGELDWRGEPQPTIGADAATVSPYLGADSLAPWVDVCRRQRTGIFVLVRTSNQGSADLQGQLVAGGGTLDERV